MADELSRTIDCEDDHNVRSNDSVVDGVIDLTADSPQAVTTQTENRRSARVANAQNRAPQRQPRARRRIARSTASVTPEIILEDEVSGSSHVPQPTSSIDSLIDITGSPPASQAGVADVLGIPSPRKRSRQCEKASTSKAQKTNDDHKNSDHLMCPICMEELVTIKSSLVSTMCGHIFCKTCIDALLNEKNAICPTCRKKITKKTVHPIYL